MPITEQQLENRKNYIGSSDAAAILGISPYRTAADVWLEKTGQVEAKNMDDNDAIQVGRYCEDAVLRWFADKQGVKILRNQFRVHENKITAAHLDALVPEKPEWIVEVKSTGITGGYVSDEWGETGTDEVPDHISIQCQHQLAILPAAQVAWVPVLMGRAGFRLYRIERNDGLISDLLATEERFWKDYVLANRMPDGVLPSMDSLKRLHRREGKQVDVPDDVVTAYLAAREASTDASKAKENAAAAVINRLGDAEIGLWSGGEVRYFEVHKKAYQVKESSYRQLTTAKRKEPK